jgi:hypothetical protein
LINNWCGSLRENRIKITLKFHQNKGDFVNAGERDVDLAPGEGCVGGAEG